MIGLLPVTPGDVRQMRVGGRVRFSCYDEIVEGRVVGYGDRSLRVATDDGSTYYVPLGALR